MSHSILILDDEPLILAGLTEKIDWGMLGCQVVGSAGNGRDGLQLLDELGPHIVITDIVMPGMTGLELAEHCYRRQKGAKIIILSAHSDFAYAQRAIQYGVNDYILKPIDPDKLVAAVRRAIADLEKGRLAQRRISQLERNAEAVRPIVSAALLFDIARHGPSEALQGNGSAGALLEPGMVLCVKVYNLPTEGGPALLAEMQRVYAAAMGGDGLALIRGSADDMMLFLCPLDRRIDTRTATARVRDSAARAGPALAERWSGVTCVGILSAPYRNPEELHRRYAACLEAIPATFFEGRHRVIEAADPAGAAHIVQAADGPAEARHLDADLLLHHLANGNLQSMCDELAALRKHLTQLRDRDHAVQLLREIHRKATTIATRAGMVNRPRMESHVVGENFAHMVRWIEGYLRDICEFIQSGQNLLGRVRLLAEQNYGDPGFGLSAAADMVGKSSSYLSRFFKKETGENFLDYLMEIRIGQARHLLATTALRNHEIARQVGFDDAHYFSQVFKKRTGMTPKQYRDAGA